MRFARIAIFGAIGALIVGFVGLMAWAMINRSPVTARSGITRVQRPAPDFTLELFGEGEVSLAENRGRPIVLNFWASWCPPCREESAGLERAWQTYGNAASFIGIDIQDTQQDAEAYVSDFNITYPNGRDVDGKITVDYGVIGLPTTFFVSKRGIVERRWVGAIPEDELVKWVEELIAGAPASGDTEGQNLDSYFPLGPP